MVSLVEPFNKFNTPRAAQLSQRSNQFNLRTVRYTEADISMIAAAANAFSFTFTLEDKFGDNGMICIIILQAENDDTLFIDTWLMSCRVLKRGMEDFVLKCLVNFAKEKGYAFLKGEYIATPKNEMVKNHYFQLGFQPVGDYFILDVASYKEKMSFITIK